MEGKEYRVAKLVAEVGLALYLMSLVAAVLVKGQGVMLYLLVFEWGSFLLISFVFGFVTGAKLHWRLAVKGLGIWTLLYFIHGGMLPWLLGWQVTIKLWMSFWCLGMGILGYGVAYLIRYALVFYLQKRRQSNQKA